MENLRIFNRSAELKYIHFCVDENKSFGYKYEKPWVYDVTYKPDDFNNKQFENDVLKEMNEFCAENYQSSWDYNIEDSKKERTGSESYFYQPLSLMLHIVLDYDIDSVDTDLPMDSFKREIVGL